MSWLLPPAIAACPLALVEIDTCALGIGLNAFFIQGFDGGGGQTQAHPTVALGPPHTLTLQVGLLQLLGAAVGVGNGEAIVGFLSGELASTGHRNGRGITIGEQEWERLTLWRSPQANALQEIQEPSRMDDSPDFLQMTDFAAYQYTAVGRRG